MMRHGVITFALWPEVAHALAGAALPTIGWAALIAAAVAALALSGQALALDPADHSADLDAAAERQAAAADCLAAAADEATVSIAATGGGGTGTLPRRATDPVGLISITCPDSSNLTLRVDYAESATCGDYLRALAVRDAPATK